MHPDIGLQNWSFADNKTESATEATFTIGALFDSLFSQNGKNPFMADPILKMQWDLLCLFAVFLIGSLVRHATDVLHLPIPYTVVIFFVGSVAGCLPLSEAADIGPHTILYVFLPVLIFEGAFAIDMYVFKQIFIQVLVLAVPALGVITGMIAVVAKYLFVYTGWNWLIALLFGSILSATDPVAVVAIMKELGTSKQLSLLIEGESMLNDGTAMVCFEVFMKIIEESDIPSVYNMIKNMVWVSLGGPLLGYVMAKISVFWLQWTFNDSLTEIAITLSMAYLAFYIAAASLEVSAVLTVVTLGATLSAHRTSISPEVETFLHSFWETLGFMANTLIFAICGSIISKKVLVNAALQDCVYLIILYFALQVTRGLTILMFAPLLRRLGYGLTWQDGLVTSWSGLRGAVGLALALIVFKSDNTELQQPAVGGKILFHVSLIVVATLMINATTMNLLLTFLGLTDVTPARRQAMKKAIRLLDESRQKVLNVWKIDRFLADADWDAVNKMCTIHDPYMDTETTEEKEQRERQMATCPRCGLPVPYVYTASELRAMTAAATRKYLKLLKQNFWFQFERGLLAGFSVRKLTELAEEAADKDNEMINVAEIKKMWRTPRIVSTFKSAVTRQMVCHTAETMKRLHREGSQCKITMYKLSASPWLVLLLFGADAVQATVTVAVAELLLLGDGLMDAFMGLERLNAICVLATCAFYVFRMIMIRRIYVKTVWVYINTINLLIACSDLVATVFFFDSSWGQRLFFSSESMEYILETLLFLRLLRILSLLEVFVAGTNYLLYHYIRSRLNTGCDVARGFVRANELAMRLIDQISDDAGVRNAIRKKAESSKMKMLRELGFLQGLHPDIALGVKTRHAIRSVLNVMREGINQLMEDGGIDEPEGLLFIKVIESKMKRLQAAPPKLQIPSVKKILAAIPWIDKEQELVDLIHELAEKKLFQYGEVIMRCGDRPDGIYFIISGLVKVEAPMEQGNLTPLQSMQTLDFLSTGNVIGEISVLTQSHRTATLTCETIVKALFLGLQDLAFAFETFAHLEPPLLDRLWRICALRISINILSSVPSYHGVRKEALLARLEHSELLNVEEGQKSLDISSSVMDTILILGKAKNLVNAEVFEGPCYIPKNVRQLDFSDKEGPLPIVFLVQKPSSGGERTRVPAQKQSGNRNFVSVDLNYRHDFQGLDNIDF
ncbi:sodium/hydrogen exchanger 10 [Aplysia californica]|uniref:Sodium/hydrogen exchanger 10 n=1 Tax=Aplysia californica TaxID=6500 RepID=A0ABM1A8B8_APLCA|nr:sodium/hydrogen exchanger 10 [Aplysia californica]